MTHRRYGGFKQGILIARLVNISRREGGLKGQELRFNSGDAAIRRKGGLEVGFTSIKTDNYLSRR